MSTALLSIVRVRHGSRAIFPVLILPKRSCIVESGWPQPGAAAQAHSEKLIAHIGRQIEAAGGWISFADYMREALYAPGLGYYSAGATKFGAAGDFITAPDVSPLFGLCLASQCHQVLRLVRGNTVVEAGAGNASLATAVLGDLPRTSYHIVEVSADLRQRQQIRLDAETAHGHDVRWLDGPHEIEPFSGVLLANEVLDALPVERFRIENGGVAALGVERTANGGFAAVARPADQELTAAVRGVESALGRTLPDGYESEIRPQLGDFIASWAEKLRSGAMLFIDYGCSLAEMYAAQRHRGTLLCHYRHRAHGNPFVYPGLQDITAWVDFTAVAEAGAAAGLSLGGYTTQAHFLLGCGIEQRFDMLRQATDDERELVRLNAQLRRLMMPGEMGERFRVMALTRDLHEPLVGFSFRDLAASL